MLLALLENGELSAHLRQTVMRAMRIRGRLVIEEKMADDAANELVMSQIVADISEPLSLLKNSTRNPNPPPGAAAISVRS